MDTYRDRRHAGQVLAAEVLRLELPANSAVLGLPRGGVTCASEVAHSLNVPLDVLLVRKLGVPTHPELAFGAIASGGFQVFNPPIASTVSEADIEVVISRERKELERREQLYGARRLELEGRVSVVVDDGLATGATMRVAIQAVRSQTPSRVVVAVPVGAVDALAMIAAIADDVVCPVAPARFRSVGEWFDDFAQVSDAEVVAMLSDRQSDPGFG